MILMLLGPPSISNLEPTHTIVDSGKMVSCSMNGNSKNTTSNEQSPPTANSTSTGLFGTNTSSNWWMPSEEVNAIMWDRLPREDYDDIEMPSHVSAIAYFQAMILLINLYLRLNGLLVLKARKQSFTASGTALLFPDYLNLLAE